MVEVAMLDVCIPAINGAIANVLEGGKVRRIGNRHSSAAPCNTYPTADGMIWIYCLTDDHWRRFAPLMGRADLIADPRYQNERSRTRIVDEVDAIVGEWTSARKRDEVVDLLIANGIPCAPVREIDEVAHDPELLGRGLIRESEYGANSGFKVLGSAIKLSGLSGDEVTSKVPELGEHTAEVLGRLGIGKAEVEALLEDGVI
jgi:formyl-CoA transferase